MTGPAQSPEAVFPTTGAVLAASPLSCISPMRPPAPIVHKSDPHCQRTARVVAPAAPLMCSVRSGCWSEPNVPSASIRSDMRGSKPSEPASDGPTN